MHVRTKEFTPFPHTVFEFLLYTITYNNSVNAWTGADNVFERTCSVSLPVGKVANETDIGRPCVFEHDG